MTIEKRNKVNRNYQPDLDGRVRLGGIHVGIVKRNDDPQRMGRLYVWVPELGGNPDDESTWMTVSYASPFGGASSEHALVKEAEDMAGSQTSYGWWAVPPDLENQVLCCWPNGDPARGFWFACAFQQNMNYMVPGIASALPTDPEGAKCGVNPPVVEYNKWSKESPQNPKRPVYEPLDGGLSRQGLYPDPERGTSTSSARREAPSLTYGYLTPRGNTIHVDDNPDNEFIRLRTRTGAQVLIHETTGYVYINSRDGNSWVEISDSGVDIYSLGTVSLRSEGSLNLHADASLNIEADGNLNLRAGGNITMQSGHHFNVGANGQLVLNAGGAISQVAGGDIGLSAGGGFGAQAGGPMFLGSGGEHVRNAPNIFDNCGKGGSVTALKAKVAIFNELPEVTGEAPCYDIISRRTIVERMPTHEPYTLHPKSGEGPPLTSSEEFPTAEEVSGTEGAAIPPADPAADVANISATELDWLTCCMIDEAANEGDDGLAAVAQVIKNRMAIRQCSNGTIKSTVIWPNQFSGFYYETSPRWHKVCRDRACAEKRGLKKIQKYKANKSKWDHVYEIGKKVMAGSYQGGAGYQAVRANKRCTMYLNLPVTKRNNPNGSWRGWAKPSLYVTTINHHTFYRTA